MKTARLSALLAALFPFTLGSAAAPADPQAPTAGKVIELKLPIAVSMKFCYCPAGSFTMGSPTSEKDRGTDEAQVQVKIGKGYWMALAECTQGQWKAIMNTTPAHQSAKGNSYGEANGLGSDHPMYFVSWEDAQEFITKLNGSVTLPAGWKVALPTEAQWEYACRAGTETAFSFGSVLNGKQANCAGMVPYGTTVKGPYLEKTCTVASYAANAWGLHDMHGNVWECVGMVRRLVWLEAPWRLRPHGSFFGRLPRASRRLVVRRRRQLPRGQPGPQWAWLPSQRPGLPSRPSSIQVSGAPSHERRQCRSERHREAVEIIFAKTRRFRKTDPAPFSLAASKLPQQRYQ